MKNLENDIKIILNLFNTKNFDSVVSKAKKLIKQFPEYVVLYNILGSAYQNIGEINIPIIVRLQGTNAVEAKKLIDDSGLKVISVILLQEAADRVKEIL